VRGGTARTGPPAVDCVRDAVVVEHHLAVEFGGARVGVLSCTPADLEDLVAGYLVGRGLLPPDRTPGEVGFELGFDSDRRSARVAAPGAAVRAREAAAAPAAADRDLRLEPADLLRLAAFLQDAPLFRLTGGTHSAAVAPASALRGDVGEADDDRREAGPAADGRALPVVLREDISRHSALDKVVGHLWLTGRLRSGGPFVLATSGRVPLEVLERAVRAGFPVVVARGAPTLVAVETAERFGLTLVGFARDGRMNIYSGPERVMV
jgi:FdhD protein